MIWHSFCGRAASHFCRHCNCRMPSGRIIRHCVRLRGRCCSGACRFSQSKIMPALEANTSLRPSQSTPWARWTRRMRIVFNSGKKDLFNLRRWEGRSFSVLQRVSVLVQRYNAVLSLDTLPATDCTDWWSVPSFVYLDFLTPFRT